MKIVFVTTHLTLVGGAGKFIIDYANKFCELGHNVSVIIQKIDRIIYKFDHKISIIEIGGPLPSSFFYWLLFKKIKKKYLKVLNRINCDIFFSHLFPTNYFCANICKKKNYKHIYYCHEPFRYFHDNLFFGNLSQIKKFLCLFFRLFFKKYDIKGTLKADNIICNSNFTRSRVKEIFFRNSYLYYPVLDTSDNCEFYKLDLRRKLNLKNDTPIIFTLSLTHHMKGVKLLIIIFKIILEKIPETFLLIGGRVTKENELIIKKLTKKLKIPNNKIIFYGYIDQKELNNIYAKSTLTFYTAINEPFGLIPLESMKCGTPVIAFEGGPSETIINGITGFLIKNQDTNQFAQKAIKLMKDKELYKKFSKNAKTHIKEKFNFKKSISDLESLFQKLISEKI